MSLRQILQTGPSVTVMCVTERCDVHEGKICDSTKHRERIEAKNQRWWQIETMSRGSARAGTRWRDFRLIQDTVGQRPLQGRRTGNGHQRVPSFIGTAHDVDRAAEWRRQTLRYFRAGSDVLRSVCASPASQHSIPRLDLRRDRLGHLAGRDGLVYWDRDADSVFTSFSRQQSANEGSR